MTRISRVKTKTGWVTVKDEPVKEKPLKKRRGRKKKDMDDDQDNENDEVDA